MERVKKRNKTAFNTCPPPSFDVGNLSLLLLTADSAFERGSARLSLRLVNLLVLMHSVLRSEVFCTVCIFSAFYSGCL